MAAMTVEPEHVGPSPEAAGVASRYEELEGRASGLEAHFERDFRTSLFPVEEGWLSLTALDDFFHSMRVALVIAPDGTILEAAGTMNRHPYDTCPHALESLRRLSGINLHAPGATTRTKEVVPRREGCLHVLDMLHVAYRAFWVAKGKDVDIDFEGEAGRRRLLELLPHVRNTCVSYAVKP
jgi:hypothetical protein